MRGHRGIRSIPGLSQKAWMDAMAVWAKTAEPDDGGLDCDDGGFLLHMNIERKHATLK